VIASIKTCQTVELQNSWVGELMRYSLIASEIVLEAGGKDRFHNKNIEAAFWGALIKERWLSTIFCLRETS
jgi:hypothetical protein